MDINRLKGMGVAMVTPFDENYEIDYSALRKLTQFLIDGGTDYLVVQGTTGESPVLTDTEKQKVLDTVVEVNAGKLPIVFGIGGNNTAKLQESFKTFNLSGVDAILSASPYYNKPTQNGIYAHYKALAESTELPIILYNVPGRTASNIEAATTLKLANDFSNIIAVKEASGSMEQVMNIIQNRPKGFLVISGDDAIAMPIVAAGGDGVISVVGNGFPKDFADMIRAALKDDMVTARELHYKVLPVIAPLFTEGNPAGIKEVLSHLGIMKNTLRLPLVNVSESLKKDLIAKTDNLYAKQAYV